MATWLLEVTLIDFASKILNISLNAAIPVMSIVETPAHNNKITLAIELSYK